jgi:hypothetical protein
MPKEGGRIKLSGRMIDPSSLGRALPIDERERAEEALAMVGKSKATYPFLDSMLNIYVRDIGVREILRTLANNVAERGDGDGF